MPSHLVLAAVCLVAVAACATADYLPYKYYYERSPQPTGEYYADTKREALNDRSHPSWITTDGCIAVSAVDNPRPVLVLEGASEVTSVRLYYSTREGWSKFAVKSFTVEASFDGIHFFHPQTCLTHAERDVADSSYDVDFKLPAAYSCVRYIRIRTVHAVAQSAAITEVELHGSRCTAPTPPRDFSDTAAEGKGAFLVGGLDTLLRR
eukprot:TRINITY_DN1187_c4_g1_i1.p1 TRINITY_DN1187_c4_g1~~TRINITY_DN1187_c4_g1_i1.p1  ORF type:complete len:226 (+),score=60.04 TRINITY_DN1187_c4_g1_i1:58-678(+)